MNLGSKSSPAVLTCKRKGYYTAHGGIYIVRRANEQWEVWEWTAIGGMPTGDHEKGYSYQGARRTVGECRQAIDFLWNHFYEPREEVAR